ncbi:MAG: hypothetical protein KBE65_05170 [Phycisphaerae bacterium]|nr:hypothetical protein [Phycisphaerae bacterium]
MNAQDTTSQALNLLREHERLIGKLYAVYADRFPDEREFWVSLSQEEEQHANWIETLQSKIEDDPAGVIVDRFPTAAIQHSIGYVNKLIDQASHPSLTRVKALSAAMDIERALLENKYFEVFASDSPTLRRTLELLDRSTRSHFQKVQQLWQDAAQRRP